MERFRTCDECSRHVRTVEAKCPFCGHALAAAELMTVPRAPAQLSRAQRIALVAAVAGGLAACGDDTGPSKPSGQGVAGATAGTSSTAGTGAAGTGAAGRGAAGRGAAGQVASPVYGAPVPPYGISPLPPPAGSGGSGGAAGAGQGGSGGSSGHSGSGGSAGAGQGGAGGASGNPAAAGRGGAIAVPLYGASPAYGLPPTPPPKK